MNLPEQLTVPCPRCRVGVGEPCEPATLRSPWTFHAARLVKARGSFEATARFRVFNKYGAVLAECISPSTVAGVLQVRPSKPLLARLAAIPIGNAEDFGGFRVARHPGS